MTSPGRGDRVWLTGATSGIGEGLAHALVARGCRVIASARGRESLDRMAGESGGAITPVAVDVADKDAVNEAVRQIDEEFGGLDCVILNAGICEYVDVADVDTDLIERVMQVNFMGTAYCVAAALPLLRKGNRPYLVGMSSASAYVGLPRAEAYGASKAAVRYMFQALDVDLLKEGIDVSVILPGFVETPLTDKNDFPMPMRVTVDEAVSAILKGMDKRRKEISFPSVFTLIIRLMARLPDGFRTRLFQRLVK